MDRRSFIRLAGGGVVLAATAACAPAAGDPRAAWVNPGANETDVRRKALSFAILAPNPHNMQPWLADLRTPGEITFHVDRARLLPVTDPFDRQITLGFGAMLELLRMALAEAGHGSEMTVFPEGEPFPRLDDRPVARVRTGGPAVPRDLLFSHVLQRRTNRGAFTDQAVTADDMAALKAVALSGAPVAVGATTEPARVARLKRLAYRGAWIEAHTAAAHRESVERTFIGARDVAEHPWGISLDAPTMSALNAVGILTKAKMATPDTPAFREALKFLKVAAETSRGFFWLTTPASSRAEQIAAGRVYVRANLAAAERGLAMHPWSQGLQEYNSQKEIMDALRGELAPVGGRLQMVCRIGHPRAPVPPAPRRGLAANLRAA